MFLTIELLMTTACAMAEEVQPLFHKPLKDRRVVGPDGPEPVVVSIMDDEWAGDLDRLMV